MTLANPAINRSIDWPLDRNRIRRGLINHTFGMVRRNGDGSRRPHQGWDFEALPGTACYAVAAGVISHVRDAGPYGLQVVLRFAHDLDFDGRRDTLYAFYAHLSRVDVNPGQPVVLGQQVGLTGNSGNAATMVGADQHLHFELRDVALPGRGLAGRYSPLHLFGHCPLAAAVPRSGSIRA